MKLVAAMFAIALSTAAAAQPAVSPNDDLSHGTLAVAAIQQGDWGQARDQLTRDDRHDAARLINLGQVYLAAGRTDQALAAWRAALAAPEQFEVTTIDGRTLTTDRLARELIAAHRPARWSALR